MHPLEISLEDHHSRLVNLVLHKMIRSICYTFMYNASIHFELATFVARNTIYRYYTQQLVVVVEWHCYCCWCNFVFYVLVRLSVRTIYVRICVVLICVSFLCSSLILQSQLFPVRKIHYCSLWMLSISVSPVRQSPVSRSNEQQCCSVESSVIPSYFAY